jgi:hypothetical protein
MILFIKTSFSGIKFLLISDIFDIIAFFNSEINEDLVFISVKLFMKGYNISA